MSRPVKEPRDCEVMVRFTAEEYAALLKACDGQKPAVYVRERALAEDVPVPDFDPRVVEVTVRSPGGFIDGVIGVYAVSRAAGMIAMRRAAGWLASYRIVEELPKVGPDLPDVEEQLEARIAELTPARRPWRDVVMGRPPDDDEALRAPKT